MFRAAAALQNRELLDLAAAEWAILLEQFPQDPLIAKARYYRGVCLARLERFAEAEIEFEQAVAASTTLDDAHLEQAYANLGLAQYRRATGARDDARADAFDAAIVTLQKQLKRYPDGRFAAQAHFYKAEACYAREKLEDAVAGYQFVVAKHSEHSLCAAALFGLGVAQQERDHHDDAGAAFDRLLTEFPEDKRAADAHLRRGEIHLAQREFGKAEKHLTAAAMAVDFADAERARALLIDVAQAQHAGGKRGAAIETLTRFQENFPNDALQAQAIYLRSQWRSEAGDQGGAVADLQRVSESWPESQFAPQALLARANLEQQQGDLSAAQATLGRFLVNYREHELAPRSRLMRASIRHEMALHEAAIEDVDVFLEVGVTSATARADALLIRGMSETELGRYVAAMRTFEELAEDHGAYEAIDRVLYELAWAQQQNGQAAQSVETFRRLATERPQSPLAAEGWFRVGESQFAAGDFRAAAESYVSAENLAADKRLKEKASHKLGWAHFELQEFDAAEAMFVEQLAKFPSGVLAADAKIMVAECKFTRADYAGALSAFQAALTDTAPSTELLELGLVHAAHTSSQLKAWEQVIVWLDRLQREFPENNDDAEIRCERGWALYHLKKLDAAREEFTAIADCDDQTIQARARFMLGEIHFARKKHDDAVRAFFKVAYGYGDGDAPEAVQRWQAESLFEAARCLEQTGRFDSAEKLYQELVARFPESEKAQHAHVAIQRRTKIR